MINNKFCDDLHAQKYRGDGEDFRDSMNRVANALKDSTDHYHAFRDILQDLRFMPGGRIQAAMGAPKVVTGFNCFVSATIEDSFVDGSDCIMDAARKAAQTMRMGGGIGYDFSTLRPSGDLIKSLGSVSSGPVSFMQIFDSVCKCIASAGHRRGAQMGVLRVDHPDIEKFIHAKQNNTALTGFNLSIGITDEFMYAVEHGNAFQLKWGGKVYREIDARNLWEMIMRSTWDYAEPGVIFIDTVNNQNNLRYCETIAASNPCFTGDTKVMTVTWGPVPIIDLVGTSSVKIFTLDKDLNHVVTTMRNIRKTAQDAELVEIEFDGGHTVRCTPQHKFYRAAKRIGQEVSAYVLASGDVVLGTYGDPLRVASVTPLEYREDVYCGTVDHESHRFYVAVGDNDGVLVANCGEQMLPPNGACLLASFNLTKYLIRTTVGNTTMHYEYEFDFAKLRADVPHVVRALDNVIDRTIYPLPEQEEEAKSKRRMGIGVTGLANCIEAIGYRYGSPLFISVQEEIMRTIRDECYRASIELAREKCAFPLYSAEYLDAPFIRSLPHDIQQGIRKHGIRNSHLLSVAPTGTISLCADNVSSGIEPVFAYEYDRTVGAENVTVFDYGAGTLGVLGKKTSEVTAKEHLAVLTTAQTYVDSAVSKTCNVSPDMPWEDFQNLYMQAWKQGAKGCTTFNSGGKRMALLKEKPDDGASCKIDPQTGKIDCD